MPSYLQEQAGLAVTVHRSDAAAPTVTVEVAGELDLASAAFCLDRLRSSLGQPGVCELLVDVSGVTFLDAAGLAPLVTTVRVAERRGQRCRLLRPSPQVARVLGILGLLELVTGP